MRKANTKVKKKVRKQLRSKTGGRSQNNAESNKTILESSIRNARIKSAIENGSRIDLPSDTKGVNLSKFEHIGKEGPLVVYAEDKMLFNEFGHFSVITSFKPTDSLRNQLFFASKPVSKSLDSEKYVTTSKLKENERHTKRTDDVTREVIATLVNPRLSSQKNNSKQTRRQPNSFEELVMRYKDRQEKYVHLVGDESLYLFQKLDRMFKAGKREIDINFAAKEELTHNFKKIHSASESKEENIVFPRIMSHEPEFKTSVKRVHIKVPQESSQLVLKDKKEEKLPSI